MKMKRIKRVAALMLALCLTVPVGVLTVSAANRTVLSPFSKHSISLQDDIAVNFYLDPARIPHGAAAVTLTYGGKQERTLLSGLTPTANGYQVTAHVTARDMTEQITAVLTVNGETVATDRYSAAAYASAVLGSPEGTYSRELTELVRAMLIYGAKSQLQFRWRTDALADAQLGDYTLPPVTDAERDAMHAAHWGSLPPMYGLKIDRISLLLYSKLSFRLYFRVTDGEAAAGTVLRASLGNETVELTQHTETETGCVYYDVCQIPAKAITDDISLTFEGAAGKQTTLKINCGEYIKTVLKGTDETLKTTVTALYRYNQAAKTYFLSLPQTPEQTLFEIETTDPTDDGWLPLIP